MLLLFFFEVDQFLLQRFLQGLDQLLVISLDLGDLDLGLLQHFVLDLVAVVLHGQGEPLLHDAPQRPGVFVLLRTLFHLPQVLVLLRVLLPSVEEGLLVVLGVKKGCKVFDLIALLLDLTKALATLRLSMQ